MVTEPTLPPKHTANELAAIPRDKAEEFLRGLLEKQSVEETFRAASAFEHAVIKALFLLNGGAFIALLTFIGRIWPTAGTISPIISAMGLPMYLFAAGLGTAFLTMAAGYLSQDYFLTHHQKITSLLSLLLTYIGSTEEMAKAIEINMPSIDTAEKFANVSRCVGWATAVASFGCFIVGSLLAVSAFTSSS